MKISVCVVTAAIFVSGAVFAESLPLKAVNKAGEVIDAGIEAHGGPEALSGLNSLIQKSEFVTFATNQSKRPGPPWDRGYQKVFNAIDTSQQLFVNHTSGEGGGYVFENGNIINGDKSFNLDYRAGTATPITEPDFNTQSGPFVRVTPALLMKQLQARRQTSHWLGEVEIEGRPHDVITLVMEVGPALSLYFDQGSHRLTRMERVLPPFGQVEYRFEDYEKIDGLLFNRNFRLYLNGEDNLIVKNLSFKVNEPVEQYTRLPENLERVAAVTPDSLSMNEIDEGVFLIGGNGTYALFVEMEDHIVAIGGTQGIPERIAELRKEIPDKPIRYGVLTHHHSDHLLGTAAYAKEGATIVTFRDNETVVRKAAGDENVKLQFVEERLNLSDGERTIEFYDIGPTPHADQILIAFLPDEGIIFEADHFPQPANGQIPPAVPATEAFASVLEKLDLDYRMIVGAHSPRVGTPADLASALNHKSFAVQGGH